jgi:glucose-6-phosphate 1-epimerase
MSFGFRPTRPPEPAAIRGGGPLCWPWFAKQGMPEDALPHGPARTVAWQVHAVHASGNDEISLRLAPCEQLVNGVTRLDVLPPRLQVSLQITLGQTLSQTLHTRNLGTQTFHMTQALHSYFSVSHARQVSIEGLTGLHYLDKLRGMSAHIQQTPFALDAACDRIYHAGSQFIGRYTLSDPGCRRRIVIDTQGSQSVVVWNPGCEGARKMVDVPNECWQNFFCIEATNVGPDVVALAPGAEHWLVQTLSIE